MDTVKVNSGKSLMVAHRGVSGIECENTNAAFIAAGNRSYFGIETDVHVTADHQFVVFHDDNTKRVSGQDYVIEESLYVDLLSIPLYDKEEGVFRSDLHIPDLMDYIHICKRYDKVAVLELKNRIPTEDIAQIVKKIGDADFLDKTIFISFDWQNLADIKEMRPEQKVQFLLSEQCDDFLIDKLAANGMDLDIYYERVTKELVDKLHAKNIEINCWTADHAEDAERLAEYGVDYITSNILE